MGVGQCAHYDATRRGLDRGVVGLGVYLDVLADATMHIGRRVLHNYLHLLLPTGETGSEKCADFKIVRRQAVPNDAHFFRTTQRIVSVTPEWSIAR